MFIPSLGQILFTYFRFTHLLDYFTGCYYFLRMTNYFLFIDVFRFRIRDSQMMIFNGSESVIFSDHQGEVWWDKWRRPDWKWKKYWVCGEWCVTTWPRTRFPLQVRQWVPKKTPTTPPPATATTPIPNRGIRTSIIRIWTAFKSLHLPRLPWNGSWSSLRVPDFQQDSHRHSPAKPGGL